MWAAWHPGSSLCLSQCFWLTLCLIRTYFAIFFLSAAQACLFFHLFPPTTFPFPLPVHSTGQVVKIVCVKQQTHGWAWETSHGGQRQLVMPDERTVNFSCLIYYCRSTSLFTPGQNHPGAALRTCVTAPRRAVHRRVQDLNEPFSGCNNAISVNLLKCAYGVGNDKYK